jgi:hypothetical protein
MKLGMRSDERHASIKVALPANRCERVRDVIDALVILEDVYNHLYASWFPDHQTCGERAHDKSQQLGRRGEFSNAPVAVPEEDRLCLAQIEIDPPAFVEIVGATEILQVIYNYWQRDELQKIVRKFSMLERLDNFGGIGLHEENETREERQSPE